MRLFSRHAGSKRVKILFLMKNRGGIEPERRPTRRTKIQGKRWSDQTDWKDQERICGGRSIPRVWEEEKRNDDSGVGGISLEKINLPGEDGEKYTADTEQQDKTIPQSPQSTPFSCSGTERSIALSQQTPSATISWSIGMAPRIDLAPARTGATTIATTVITTTINLTPDINFTTAP